MGCRISRVVSLAQVPHEKLRFSDVLCIFRDMLRREPKSPQYHWRSIRQETEVLVHHNLIPILDRGSPAYVGSLGVAPESSLCGHPQEDRVLFVQMRKHPQSRMHKQRSNPKRADEVALILRFLHRAFSEYVLHILTFPSSKQAQAALRDLSFVCPIKSRTDRSADVVLKVVNYRDGSASLFAGGRLRYEHNYEILKVAASCGATVRTQALCKGGCRSPLAKQLNEALDVLDEKGLSPDFEPAECWGH